MTTKADRKKRRKEKRQEFRDVVLAAYSLGGEAAARKLVNEHCRPVKCPACAQEKHERGILPKSWKPICVVCMGSGQMRPSQHGSRASSVQDWGMPRVMDQGSTGSSVAMMGRHIDMLIIDDPMTPKTAVYTLARIDKALK